MIHFEDRATAVFTAAAGLTALDKSIRIVAARGLMMIGNADGEVDENGKKFFTWLFRMYGHNF